MLLGINPLNQPVFFSTGQADMAENTNDADEMRNWPMVNALGPVARSGDTRHDCVGANKNCAPTVSWAGSGKDVSRVRLI